MAADPMGSELTSRLLHVAYEFDAVGMRVVYTLKNCTADVCSASFVDS